LTILYFSFKVASRIDGDAYTGSPYFTIIPMNWSFTKWDA